MKRRTLAIVLSCILTIICFSRIVYGNESLEYDDEKISSPSGFDYEQYGAECQDTPKSSKIQTAGFQYQIVDDVMTISGTGEMPDGYMENWQNVKGSIRKVIIEKGVTSICDGAFYDCYCLEEVQLPEGLKTIGEYAFQNTALKTVNLPKSITTVKSLAFFNNNSFDNSQLESFTIGESAAGGNSKYIVENGALYSASKKKIVICPPGKTGTFTVNAKTVTIGEDAFLDSRLSKVILPSGLQKIEFSAFARSNLSEVLLPSTVTSIGDCVYQDSISLKKINFGSGLKKLGYRTCSGCSNLTEVKLRNLTDLDYLSFAECTSLKTVSIPKGVKEIKNGTFGDCYNLAEVKFLGSTKEIWYQAFFNCQKLKNINLPPSLTEINRLAFWGTGLTSVKIPSKVVFIGEEAFPKGCKFINMKNCNLKKMSDGSYQYVGVVHVSSYRDYTKAFAVLSKVNSERKKAGLPALKMDKSLLDTAMLRASETSVYWSHTRPTGTDCFTASSKMYGENIAVGQSTADMVMTSWMNSEGHRANILTEDYTTIGIGAVKVNGLYYWVQCFGIDKGEKALKKNYKNKTVSTKVFVKKKGNENYKYSFKSTCAGTVKKGKSVNLGIFVHNTFALTKVKATDFTYKSSNKNIATVSSTGKVTGKKKGTVKITAKMKKYPAITVTKKIKVK